MVKIHTLALLGTLAVWWCGNKEELHYGWDINQKASPMLGHVELCKQKTKHIICTGSISPENESIPRYDLVFKTLKSVNTFVNDNIEPKSDQDNYGVAENWQDPTISQNWNGDCDDYVLAKISMLRENHGFPLSAFKFIVVKTTGENPEWHIVLWVKTDEWVVILDNRSPDIKLVRNIKQWVESMGYTLQKITWPNGLKDWRKVI
jgi:predicted transglutaminase-like cysteine proteinase